MCQAHVGFSPFQRLMPQEDRQRGSAQYMSIPSCTIFAREWTAKVCLRLCMQAPPERLLEQGILHFSNTFLKPPKTVQEDNGRPDGDINKNLSGASTSGKGILLRYSNTVVEPWTGVA